jgi:hypothetical protein
VVSRSSTRGGTAAGGVGSGVRRARRWLRPKALPPRAPMRRSCRGDWLKSLTPGIRRVHRTRNSGTEGVDGYFETDRARQDERELEAIQQPELIPAIVTAPVASEAGLEPEAAPATPVAPQTPHVAPEEPPAKTSVSRAKKAPVANTGAPREGSKTSQVIAMLKRDGGTTLEEIMSAMGWQKHTTRAMLSAGGSLRKNTGWS